jgi:hypothetical protein
LPHESVSVHRGRTVIAAPRDKDNHPPQSTFLIEPMLSRCRNGAAVESSIDLIDYFDPRNRNLSLLCIATSPI